MLEEEDVVVLLLLLVVVVVVLPRGGGLSPPSLEGSGIDRQGKSIDSLPPSTPLNPSDRIVVAPFPLLLPRVIIPPPPPPLVIIMPSWSEPFRMLLFEVLLLEGWERKGIVTMLALLTVVPTRPPPTLLWEGSPIDAVEEVVVVLAVLF